MGSMLRPLATMAFAAMLAATLSIPAKAADDARTQAEDQARALVNQLTLAEKVEQLLNVAPAIPRLAIPSYHWWTESLHGALGPVPTTNFPEPIGIAATFDDALVHDVARAIGAQVRDLHGLFRQLGKSGRIGGGLDTWSPNINIFRDPRWGRGQETYGEDPFLCARMAVAYVRGMQGDDPDHPLVIATPKHFAVHSGPESTRHQANVFVSPHDLEDTYLPAFRAAIVEGHAGSIMCAYNRVDGQPACANDLLLKERLRGGFEYAPVSIAAIQGDPENGVRVATVVRNTSARAGEEVAEVYLAPPDFEGAPRLALRGFQRLALAPGESHSVTFELSPRDLSFVTRDGQRQIFPGAYRVTIGSGQPDTGVPFQAALLHMSRAVPIPE